MSKNVRQFLLSKVLTYYRETIMPSLACLGVKSDRFVPLLEELAWEVKSDLTLSNHQQKEFLDLLTDISIQMFEANLLIHLINYKKKLRNYLESCYVKNYLESLLSK
jgi:hypothetical protein